MMKKTLLILMFFPIAPAAWSQKVEKQGNPYIIEVRGIIKKHSLFTKALNWPYIDRELKTRTEKGITTGQTDSIVSFLIQQLRIQGDHHSFIMSPTASKNYSSSAKKLQSTTGKVVANTIGYIQVPGFPSTNDSMMKVFAQVTQNKIAELDTSAHISGWIIDLRENFGGNMYPMIAGLAPFLRAGKLGYFVNNSKKTYWTVIKNQNKARSGSAVVSAPYRLRKSTPRIAVLIGPNTASSGEFTAISFIGEKNVRLFGQPSAGLTTANRSFLLSNGATLNLAATYVTDRRKKKYPGPVPPDVVVEPAAGADADIESAVEWLLAK